MPTKHILISGKVQGVFYRATAREVAEKLGIKGWIRNTYDGDVEARISGTASQLSEFIDWCKKGPKAAVVTRVSSEDIADENFENFTVMRG